MLEVTAAELGLTPAELGEYLNVPFNLAKTYQFQKNTLDDLIWALSTNDTAAAAAKEKQKKEQEAKAKAKAAKKAEKNGQ